MTSGSLADGIRNAPSALRKCDSRLRGLCGNVGRKALLCAFAASTLLAPGCGASTGPALLPTVAASGVVLMDGKPLPAAMVTFTPLDEGMGPDCQGVTDAEGRFQLKQVRGGEVAPVGSFKVVVNPYVKSDGTVVALAEGEFPANVGATESLPPRYSSAMETELKSTVTDATDGLKIELKST